MAAGIHSVLSSASDLRIVALPEGPEMALLAEIRQLAPAIVIADSASWLRLWPWLNALEDGSRVRIVLVDEGSNRVHICDWDTVILRRGADLRQAVEADDGHWVGETSGAAAVPTRTRETDLGSAAGPAAR